MIYFDTAYILNCHIIETGSEAVQSLASQHDQIACCDFVSIQRFAEGDIAGPSHRLRVYFIPSAFKKHLASGLALWQFRSIRGDSLNLDKEHNTLLWYFRLSLYTEIICHNCSLITLNSIMGRWKQLSVEG